MNTALKSVWWNLSRLGSARTTHSVSQVEISIDENNRNCVEFAFATRKCPTVFNFVARSARESFVVA